MGRLIGFLKRNSAIVITTIVVVLVAWSVNEATSKAETALEVANGFETRIEGLEKKTGTLEGAVGSLNGSLRSFVTASAQADSEANARMDSLALEVSATAFVADTAMTRASSARKDAREARKAFVVHSAADSVRWAAADSVRRSTVAVDSVTVSQIRLAAYGAVRKADAALVRADSLDAARARHEMALLDLAARMSGKKKK